MNPPKPTAIKILHGNPGKRPLNREEPKPLQAFTDEPPFELDDTARAEWSRLLPILKQMRVLTAADYGCLSGLCLNHSIKLKALKQLMTEGLTVPGPLGSTKTNPAWKVFHDAGRSEDSAMQQFGLTPASRTRIRMEPKPDEGNPWSKVG